MAIANNISTVPRDSSHDHMIIHLSATIWMIRENARSKIEAQRRRFTHVRDSCFVQLKSIGQQFPPLGMAR